MTVTAPIRLRVLPRLIPIDGKNVELQTTATEVQWRVEGESTWQTLVPLSAITGPQGVQGPPGQDGGGVPNGGTTRQVLAKSSGADQDVEWIDAGTGDLLSTNNGSDFADKPTTVVNIGAEPSFSTQAEAEAFTPASPVGHLRTAGYEDPGDGGGLLFQQVDSDPGTPLSFPHVGGKWMEAALSNELRPEILGGKAGGSVDCLQAIGDIDDFIQSKGVGRLLLDMGQYSVGDDITIASPVEFRGGGMLRPDSGKTIQLDRGFRADSDAQIFELADGGYVRLPLALHQVCGEWWGAKGDGVKADNDIPIQQANNALADSTRGGRFAGGIIRLGRGDFYTSSKLSLSGKVKLAGFEKRATALIVSTGSWDGSTRMVEWVSGTAQFNCGLDDINLNANSLSTIAECAYADCFNEGSGFSDVLITKVKKTGILLEEGRGSADFGHITRTEVFFDDASNYDACGIYAKSGNTSAFSMLKIDEATVAASGTVTSNSRYGLRVGRKMIVRGGGFHPEFTPYGIYLEDDARLFINGVTGHSGSLNLIALDSGYTGQLEVKGIDEAGSTNILNADAVANAHTFFKSPTRIRDNRVYWPMRLEALLAARLSNGTGTPVVDYATDPLSFTTKSATGVYEFSIASGAFPAGAYYDVYIADLDIGVVYTVTGKGATAFIVKTFNPTTGAAADTGRLSVRLFPRP